MIVIPAVDVRDGRCVRLRQGRADEETVFSADPVAMAVRWASLGASRLHVVDLDGAFAGAPRQTRLVAEIVKAVAPVPVEVGGGLRDLAAVSAALDTGARWAVVGTRAAVDHVFLAAVCDAHPDAVIVAVDAHGDRVAIKGWTETSGQSVVALGERARAAGAAALLYTDVSRDGTGLGPNVEQTAALARATGSPVIASGGVGSVADLHGLAGVPGVIGVVVGRALYTGAIDLRDAIVTMASSTVDSRSELVGGAGGGAAAGAPPQP